MKYITGKNNDNLGWGSCGFGGIINTTNGGLTSIIPQGNSEPNNFKLNQNYPNPFNGQTTFEFEVSEKSNYRFTIYDMLGRKISNLFNGNLNTGKYKINFNSEGLYSGTYFYRLISERIILTKSFQLIK
ncbi:MAG: T9SS type A sorting domain-containing protein [Bacteroidota bacterium]|nr:T9SS type A sorting domain-containing protein [Bacteroidota bacterium]